MGNNNPQNPQRTGQGSTPTKSGQPGQSGQPQKGQGSTPQTGKPTGQHTQNKK